MKRWIVVGLIAAVLAAGCGSSKDKNKNKDAGRPVSGEKSETPKPKG
jgi:hypothetical protein